MSEFEAGLPPTWFRDISNAFALSTQSTPERRLQAFLATLSSEETENHAGVLLTRADNWTPPSRASAGRWLSSRDFATPR